MPQIVVTRSTLQANSSNENRIVRHIDEKIGDLEPNIAPLVTLLMKLNKRRGIDSPVHEWMEQDYIARWGQVTTATVNATTSATTINVDDGTKFTEGDVIMKPSSTGGGEIMRVTTVSSNVITVTRAFAGSTVDTLNVSDALRLIGSAYAEGTAIPPQKISSPVTLTTYLQIWKKSIKFTKTAVATKLHGAPSGERKREHTKKLKEFKEQMNSALLWGKASQDTSGSTPLRSTMGLNSRISTNVANAGGILTFRSFLDWSMNCFRYGSQEKVLLAPGVLVNAINTWALDKLRLKEGDRKLGLNINQLEMGHGTWLVVRDYMLEAPPAGTNGFSGVAFSVDLSEVEYMYLSGNGENRDTKLLLDQVRTGVDAYEDLILAEGGYRVGQEKFHGKMYGITSYQ